MLVYLLVCLLQLFRISISAEWAFTEYNLYTLIGKIWTVRIHGTIVENSFVQKTTVEGATLNCARFLEAVEEWKNRDLKN